MKEIASKYGSYKNSAKILALLAALTQPEESSISPSFIVDLRKKTASMINRNASSAHDYAKRAVEANPECYQALFELATDLVAGEIRTGDASEQDVNKSLELYKKGLDYAQKFGDSEYVNLFSARIEQVTPLVEDSYSE